MITVLYVENEENDVLFMRRAFNRVGLEGCLRPVSDARSAMRYLVGEVPYSDRTAHPFPVLLLMDLNLPALSGFELLHWLREQPQLQQLPVVIFSSSARPEDIERAQTLGAHDYLQKPRSGSEFVEVAQRLRDKWLVSSGV